MKTSEKSQKNKELEESDIEFSDSITEFIDEINFKKFKLKETQEGNPTK